MGFVVISQSRTVGRGLVPDPPLHDLKKKIPFLELRQLKCKVFIVLFQVIAIILQGYSIDPTLELVFIRLGTANPLTPCRRPDIVQPVLYRIGPARKGKQDSRKVQASIAGQTDIPYSAVRKGPKVPLRNVGTLHSRLLIYFGKQGLSRNFDPGIVLDLLLQRIDSLFIHLMRERLFGDQLDDVIPIAAGDRLAESSLSVQAKSSGLKGRIIRSDAELGQLSTHLIAKIVTAVRLRQTGKIGAFL